MNQNILKIAYFISPHGFGHAARACSVMEALCCKHACITFEVFTRVPQWFFQDSLSQSVTYNDLLTDVGLVQLSPLEEDVFETVKVLDSFLPFDKDVISRVSGYLKDAGCSAVLCDIAPLGVAIAEKAGIPSFLVENFTWDWIYKDYARENPELEKHIDYLKKQFQKAVFHLQAEPVCSADKGAFRVDPISRRLRSPRDEMRNKLGIPQRTEMVMLTMGGIREKNIALEKFKKISDITFVIPGASDRTVQEDNLVLLPFHSDFYHPDLINASDAVVGKVGYSTLAEAYRAGVPYGYFTREKFKESDVLDEYVQKEMKGIAFTDTQYKDGSWLDRLHELLSLSRIDREVSTGAEQAAAFILDSL